MFQMRADRARGREEIKNLYQVKVLDKIVKILDCFIASNRDLKLAEVVRRTGFGKSTTHRLLMVLQGHGMVEQNPQTAEYRLGLKLFEWGSYAISRRDLPKMARPILEKLVEEVEETAHISVLDHGEILYLDMVESPHPLRTVPVVGQKHPVHCTAAGKSMIAYTPQPIVIDIIGDEPFKRFTKNTITDWESLWGELAAVRKARYAVSNEEVVEGLLAIGAPIFNHLGQPIASLVIAGPTVRLTPEKVPEVARKVVAAGEEIAARLGYNRATRTYERGR